MVIIQVVIAEVSLDNLDEFGVELGLQDSLLFSRGIGTPGFNFNNQPLGNNVTPESLGTREELAGQGLSNFSLGRTNSDLGYGGLVLSASNESVSILIRALQQSRRLQVISRPQVQTLDNQPAFVQVGARVPFITSSNQTQFGIQNVTTLENVGILLGVTPRTSPDGLIVMEINAEKSELSPEAQGIPIFVNNTGQIIRSPQIFITTAQTTVSAQSGQTVILGGLITKTREQETRRVPYMSDIPVLGRLFRYDREQNRKRELLIIMTPYVVRTDEDIEMINAKETERMNWCLADVAEAHGELPWAKGVGPWNKPPTPLIFPDQDPTGQTPSSVDRDPPPAGAEENRFEPIETEPTPGGVFERQPR
jgi:type II secretory pathway component GspD/PulD (secretin)